MAESGRWEPKIVAFLCNWCSYAGADLAGTSRIQYPPNVRILRVPCSGRVNPFFILSSLQKGVDGVLVSGCHPGECHYLTGNYSARRKFALLKSLLEFAGVEEGRVQFSWVSASEGVRFAKLVEQVTRKVRALGPAKRLVKTPSSPYPSPPRVGERGRVRGGCACGEKDGNPHHKRNQGNCPKAPPRQAGGRGHRL